MATSLHFTLVAAVMQLGADVYVPMRTVEKMQSLSRDSLG
jgi:hypothetical protein